MNTNDLMIGDWVLYEGSPKKIALLDDAGCALLCPGENEEIIVERDLQPIPLTAEIMKSIGFTKSKAKNGSYFLNGEGSDYLLHYFEASRGRNGELQASIFSPDDEELHRWIAPVNYVHELQLALRLFHIDLEVKL